MLMSCGAQKKPAVFIGTISHQIMSLTFESATAPSGPHHSLQLQVRVPEVHTHTFRITVCCSVCIMCCIIPAEHAGLNPPVSCLAPYLWAADNCSLDNVKVAYAGEWGLLQTVIMPDFMQFVMRGFVFPIILKGLTAEATT